MFGTFEPTAGQTIFNLRSQGILNTDGSPGPNFARARQWEANATGAYSIHPVKTAPYAQLPGHGSVRDLLRGDPVADDLAVLRARPDLDLVR